MPESDPSDSDLLAVWLERRDERAFHLLVERYAGLVHMAALRRVGDESLAAEVSQLTFIALARKAKSLVSRKTLAGWLHITAMMHAKNLVRQRSRESRKLQQFQQHMDAEPPSQAIEDWKRIKPVLDDALAALSDKDRETLLLRFYRSLSVREVAASLGIATDAAQKRLNRATERLRKQLSRRGCQTGASLGAVLLLGLGSDAQAAVPAVSTLAGNALAAGTAGGGFTLTTVGIIIMTKKATIAATLALVLAGIGTIKLISNHDTKPETAGKSANVRSKSQGPQDKVDPSSGEAASRGKSNRSRPAVKNPELASKYGESRTNLSKHITENVISMMEDTVEMGEMAYSGQLAGTFGGPDGALRMSLGSMDNELQLTDDQREKAKSLIADYQKKQIEKSRDVVDRLKKDPTSLMQLMLASDAFSRGEIDESEYKRLQQASSEDLDGVLNPLDEKNLHGGLMPDDEFLNELKPILDPKQNETLQAHLDEKAAAATQITPAEITSLPAMQLEKLDTTIQSVKKLTTGVKSMLEGFGGLQDLKPLLEQQGGQTPSE